MGMRLRSLAEDCTDAYSNTWSVAFFLILALILILTPPPPQSPFSSNNKNLEFDIDCWAPFEFWDHHVNYTRSICSKKFVAWLHEKPEPIVPKNNNKNNDVDNDSNDIDKPDGKSSSEDISSIKTPVLMFILAIALRIPRLLWSVMSRCCNGNGFNVGRTLESAEKGDVMSLDGRRQMYAGLFQAIQKHTRRSGKTVTGLYLFMKAVMILVLVAEIIVVTVHVLPQLRHEDPRVVVAAAGHGKTDSDSVANVSPSPSSSSKPRWYAGKPIPHDWGLSQTDRMEFLKGLKYNAIFYCPFTVMFRHRYTVQCIIQQQQQQQQLRQKQQLQQQQKQQQDERQELFPPLLQPNVFLIALASLIFLLIFNVVSALCWLAVLANQSTRTGLGLRLDSPLDLVFLLQMARDNLSAGVAIGLVNSVHGVESTKG